MKAMIFAAGLGTRLRPYTETRPKALVEVGGIPLLEIAIRRLKFFGCREIIINVHHFGDQIVDFLRQRQNFGLDIALSDERDLLLDTGGGLKQAAWFFGSEPFIVVNADILTDLDLAALYRAHCLRRPLATLAVQHRTTSRYLLFNTGGILCGWRNDKTGATRFCRPDTAWEAMAFSGIHVIDPAIFRLMPEERVFSIIDIYLEAGKKHEIRAFPHDDTFWADVGKPASLERAEQLVGRLALA